MWDGLLDLLTEWFHVIWCLVLNGIIELGFVFLKVFCSIWPSFQVPSWLQSWSWEPSTLNLLSLFFPFFAFFFIMQVVLFLELTLWIGIPTYRSIMDLF
jgi:hypothetical protein